MLPREAHYNKSIIHISNYKTQIDTNVKKALVLQAIGMVNLKRWNFNYSRNFGNFAFLIHLMNKPSDLNVVLTHMSYTERKLFLIDGA